MRCSAITSSGDRCKLDATNGSFCWSHAPETAQARKMRGRRGGKARGAGELAEIKRSIREVIEEVRDGSVERGVGAVVFQGFNSLLKALEVERRVREQEELLVRLERLEEAQKGGLGGRHWGT